MSNINQNRITDQQHEVYLNKDQKEFIRIMSKSELEKRQQDIVAESGHDGLKEFEQDLAQQQARFEASLKANNETIRRKKNQNKMKQ